MSSNVVPGKRISWIIAGIGCALAVAYTVRGSVVHAFHGDACLVISSTIADRIDRGDTISVEVLNAEVLRLIGASVIHGGSDTDGNPIDLNGNPFEVEIESGRVKVSTKRSLLLPLRARAIVGTNRGSRDD